MSTSVITLNPASEGDLHPGSLIRQVVIPTLSGGSFEEVFKFVSEVRRVVLLAGVTELKFTIRQLCTDEIIMFLDSRSWGRFLSLAVSLTHERN